MWILFLILITEPGAFRVQVLETYKNVGAEAICKAEAMRLYTEFEKTYTDPNEQYTYSFICLKQKEKTA